MQCIVCTQRWAFFSKCRDKAFSWHRYELKAEILDPLILIDNCTYVSYELFDA
jgi:hypothetical protein